MSFIFLKGNIYHYKIIIINNYTVEYSELQNKKKIENKYKILSIFLFKVDDNINDLGINRYLIKKDSIKKLKMMLFTIIPKCK